MLPCVLGILQVNRTGNCKKHTILEGFEGGATKSYGLSGREPMETMAPRTKDKKGGNDAVIAREEGGRAERMHRQKKGVGVDERTSFRAAVFPSFL